MADVQIVTPDGTVGSVDESELQHAEELGARLAGPKDILQGEYGGAEGQVATGAIAGLNTLLPGVGTGLVRQLGRMTGGKQGEIDAEIGVHNLNEANPYSKIAGETIPLLAAPWEAEAGVSGLLEEFGVAQGKGAFDRALRFAAPHFAQGVADMERIGVGEAVSEAQLDPDKAAEAYWDHAGPGAALLGGVLNVGLASGFKGLGNAFGKVAETEFGRVGEQAAAHSEAFESALVAGQKAGMTSDVSDGIFRNVMSGANEARSLISAGEKEAAGIVDKRVAEYIRTSSASPEQARQWTKTYQLAKGTGYTAERVMADHGIELSKRISVIGGFDRMANEIQFQFKAPAIREKVDPRLLRVQADELLNFADTLESTLLPPELPAEPIIPRFKPPAPPRGMSKDEVARAVSGMGRKEGFRLADSLFEPHRTPEVPAFDPGAPGINRPLGASRLDPDAGLEGAFASEPAIVPSAIDEYAARVRAAQQSHVEMSERIMAEHQANVQRILQEHAQKADPIARQLWGMGNEAVALRPDMAAGDLSKLRQDIHEIRKGVKNALKIAEGSDREGAVAMFQTMDGVKKLIGKVAHLGRENAAVGKNVSDYFYHQLRYVGENPNVWGSDLAALQADGNAAFYDEGKRKIVQSVLGELGDSKLTPGGRPLVRGDAEKAASWMRKLGSDVAQDPTNSLAHADFEATMDNVLGRAKFLKEHHALTPQQAEAVDAAVRAATEAKGIVQSAHLNAQDFRAIDAMLGSEGRSGIRGLIGTAINFAMNPGKRLQVLAGFSRIEKQVRGLIEKHAKGFISKGEAMPVLKGPTGEAEKRVAIRMMDEVRKFRDNPATLGGSLKGILSDVTMQSPVLTSAVATVAARAIMYLAEHVPEPLPQRLSDRTATPRYADSDIEQFWQKVQLVQKPTLAMHRLASNQFRYEDTQMMKRVFPALFNDMQGMVRKELETARANGQLRQLSYQEQLLLTWFLEQPLDGTHTLGFARTMQLVAQQDPNAQGDIGAAAQGGGRPRNVDINLERYETTLQNLEK